MKITILGLSITSSWGNGHATTYRSLIRGLAERGHEVLFLERDVPWYRDNRDLPKPPYCTTRLYGSIDELRRRHRSAVEQADVVIVGSYVPDGITIGRWALQTARNVTAFYDIDTPVTLAALRLGTCNYLAYDLVPRYHLYLSFTGGPVLRTLERDLGSPYARTLYCSVDPDLYYPDHLSDTNWDVGYLGTYSADRQPLLQELLIAPALQRPSGRFVVAGPKYPPFIAWPSNVDRIEHLPPTAHRYFYSSQRLTLNVTRADMRAAGYSPSVRLFEAAACGVAIVSDSWPGLSDLFTPGEEILLAQRAADVLFCLNEHSSADLEYIGYRAREKTLALHTGERRARELEEHVASVSSSTDQARSGPLVA